MIIRIHSSCSALWAERLYRQNFDLEHRGCRTKMAIRRDSFDLSAPLTHPALTSAQVHRFLYEPFVTPRQRPGTCFAHILDQAHEAHVPNISFSPPKPHLLLRASSAQFGTRVNLV